MNTKGYTMVELLLAMAVSLLATTLLCAIALGVKQVYAELRPSRHRAIMQMRTHYVMAKNHEWTPSSWSFDYRAQRMQASFQEGRLVLTPGWQVWMDGVEKGTFDQREGCLWVSWLEQKRKHEALLGCE